MITHAHMLPTQHGTPCAVLAGVFWIAPLTATISPRVTITCLGPWRRLWRAGGSWGSGTVVHPATCVLRGRYNETCAMLGQVPKQWWSVPVVCLVLPSVCCHCGVVTVVKYKLNTFLDPCLCFTWTTLIQGDYLRGCRRFFGRSTFLMSTYRAHVQTCNTVSKPRGQQITDTTRPDHRRHIKWSLLFSAHSLHLHKVSSFTD
jgi:hypothetical protein